MSRHEISHNQDGSYTVEGAGSQSSELQVLPPQNSLGTSAGTCGADGRQFCNARWPEEILGPIPQTPPHPTSLEIIPSSDNNNKSMICGGQCKGPSDCGNANPDTDCLCKFPSLDDVRRLGLDPVAPQRLCLASAASVVVEG